MQGHAGWRMRRCTHPRTTLSKGLDRDRLHFIPDKSRWEAAADGRRSKPCRRFRFEHAHPAYHRSQGGTVSSALRQHVGVTGRGFAGTSALRQLVDPARHRDSADVPSPPTALGRVSSLGFRADRLRTGTAGYGRPIPSAAAARGSIALEPRGRLPATVVLSRFLFRNSSAGRQRCVNAPTKIGAHP
jgi:hypothetical protein